MSSRQRSVEGTGSTDGERIACLVLRAPPALTRGVCQYPPHPRKPRTASPPNMSRRVSRPSPLVLPGSSCVLLALYASHCPPQMAPSTSDRGTRRDAVVPVEHCSSSPHAMLEHPVTMHLALLQMTAPKFTFTTCPFFIPASTTLNVSSSVNLKHPIPRDRLLHILRRLGSR